ncbi:MAG: hypothetical protein J6Y37_11560 [Paludibacteraceae bacterium]|nr:hypothetical protein [Paludibacteraceae bacterium]
MDGEKYMSDIDLALSSSDRDALVAALVDELSYIGCMMFGRFSGELASLLAGDVADEMLEAGDGDVQKAVAFVVGEKFGMFNEEGFPS